MTRKPERDEMVDGKGGLRPQWRGVLAAFASLGEGGLAERARRLAVAFEEEGVTSVLPGASADATWRCDPVPLVLAAAEFALLEDGLAQRARLLETVLDDVYGERTLLARGLLPPALVFANPEFLRHAPGAAPRPLLHMYAADLLRDPDGVWRVVADRAEAPAGAGYARENRRLLSRVLPEAFRPMQVRAIRPFFETWQDALQRLAPEGSEAPAVALLTPGTGHPRWFEHLYLARELSCALVESGDLTVRDGGLFMKSLRGLQRIDVLLRRTNGRQIDPLELDTGASSGIPGLLDAVRGGAVRVVNDPGTGFVEAPALGAFLPRLAQALIGETLALGAVETVWLDQPDARARVLADLDSWLIRPALDGQTAALSPPRLSPQARARLAAEIAARPWRYCATADVPPSVAPCVDGNTLSPRPIVLRMFLVRDGERWTAMPGGLARVVEPSGALAGGLPPDGLSKDVWVLSEDRADLIGPAAPVQKPVAIRRTTADLPSRVADNLFWLGRYVERLDRTARLSRATISRLSRSSQLLPRDAAELSVLARCLVEAGVVPRDVLVSAGAGETALAAALLAAARPTGPIEATFNQIGRLVDGARDRLTGDMYGTFTQTLRAARAAVEAAGRSLDALAHGMVSIHRFAAAFAGVTSENMVRAGGFLFLDLGRRVERAQVVTSEIATALDLPPARILVGMQLILELCDSAITYRSRYLGVLQPAPVLDLVLADEGNPRGLAFQLIAIHGLLDELGGGAGARDRLAGAAAGLLAEAEAAVEAVLRAPDQSVAAAEMPTSLREISAGLIALSDRITRRFFALLPVAQTVSWTEDADAFRGAA